MILKFMREWWFVAFALVLLLAGLFVERFYCRYLCPLGAALAIPARLRVFDWLRRYPMCGNPCQRCAHDCPVQAIQPEGDIDPNECIQCLNCQMLLPPPNRLPACGAGQPQKAKAGCGQSRAGCAARRAGAGGAFSGKAV